MSHIHRGLLNPLVDTESVWDFVAFPFEMILFVKESFEMDSYPTSTLRAETWCAQLQMNFGVFFIFLRKLQESLKWVPKIKGRALSNFDPPEAAPR